MLLIGIGKPEHDFERKIMWTTFYKTAISRFFFLVFFMPSLSFAFSLSISTPSSEPASYDGICYSESTSALNSVLRSYPTVVVVSGVSATDTLVAASLVGSTVTLDHSVLPSETFSFLPCADFGGVSYSLHDIELAGFLALCFGIGLLYGQRIV